MSDESNNTTTEDANNNQNETAAAEPVAAIETTAEETSANEISTSALVKIEGQEFALDAAIAKEDNLLKTALSPHYPSIKNANITRETAATGQMIVSIVKRAEHKGSGEQKA